MDFYELGTNITPRVGAFHRRIAGHDRSNSPRAQSGGEGDEEQIINQHGSRQRVNRFLQTGCQEGAYGWGSQMPLSS
jgi:hypothetical protein